MKANPDGFALLSFGVSLLAGLLGCGSRHAAMDRVAPPPTRDRVHGADALCEWSGAVPSSETLYAAIGPGAPTLTPSLRPVVVMAQLDGEGEYEAAMLARVVAPQQDAPWPPLQRDVLWVFEHSDSGWVLRAQQSFETTADGGTYETPQGASSIEPVPLVGSCHHMLAVGVEDAQGGADPRWSETRLELWGLAGNALSPLLRCARSREVVRGPSRAGSRVDRSFDLATPGLVRVQSRGSSVGGVDDSPGADPPPNEEASYQFDGVAFRTDDGDLCATPSCDAW